MNLNIASLIVDSKTMTFDHPDHKGFAVTLNYTSKTRMAEIRKECVETRYDAKLGYPVQELDQEKWISAFSKEVIRGWEGLTMDILAQLMLIDETGSKGDDLIGYTEDNALLLITRSTSFDNWVNSCLSDLNNFRSSK